jgi:hypothetical protein
MKVSKVQQLLCKDLTWQKYLKDPVKMQEWRKLYEDVQANLVANTVKRVSTKAATQAASKLLALFQAQVNLNDIFINFLPPI